VSMRTPLNDVMTQYKIGVKEANWANCELKMVTTGTRGFLETIVYSAYILVR
jgi:hypothetical protein